MSKGEAIRLLPLAGVLARLGGTMAEGQRMMQSSGFPEPSQHYGRWCWCADSVGAWIRGEGERERV